MLASLAYAGTFAETRVTKPGAHKRRIPSREVVIRRLSSERAFERSHTITGRFAPGELVDLQCIAEAWDTDLQNVVWHLVSEKLAELRGRDHAKLPWSREVRKLLSHIGRIHPGQLEEGEREDQHAPDYE